ncbi:peptidase domain-containing ABC transporter [Rivularia sp. UHCC 0363]|uniref:peptidase domain-containing ABC transporter n=1 Tax=Rivularia sp. UHCC 0363 TaxID=3110244 RepID=UPI002B21FC38|nr:peptidase domain-containing ABC transporter [Rivularia sp. UHCC 0363]MEA5596975.1 peptidase domain-containing ABC transporter [Rivularia sp. UHCC 0363]
MNTISSLQDFLASIYPFNQLPSQKLENIAQKIQPLRYRMGQTIFVRETMPDKVVIIYEGQARLLGYSKSAKVPETLKLFKPGEIIGWTSMVRGVPCETVIATIETNCISILKSDFIQLLESQNNQEFTEYFYNQPSLIEVYELLGTELERRAVGLANLKQLATDTLPQSQIINLSPGKTPLSQLDSTLMWLVSSKGSNCDVGTRLFSSTGNESFVEVKANSSLRLVGLEKPQGGVREGESERVREGDIKLHGNSKEISNTNISSEENIPPSYTPSLPHSSSSHSSSLPLTSIWDNAPFAPATPEAPEPTENEQFTKYPYIHGRGPVDATLACFQMLSLHWKMPWKRDVLKRALSNSYKRTGGISIQLCGAVAELTGLSSQLVQVPAGAIAKLPTPVMLPWQDSFAILYKASSKELILAIPEQGIRHINPTTFAETWGEEGQVLLLQQTSETPQKRFGLSWFLPAIKKYKNSLITVFVASFFVQLLGLANPLITQVIIDKVIVQNSISTLNVLGSLLIVMAIVEGIMYWLRTNLFVDTTNRIDLSLGSVVIEHLLRLPLRYFERRPVGEVSSRINELENIRSFLTGTALTVVLDAVFSVIYIAVMIFYSWLLTIVALSTIPLFALLTFIVAPIIRGQTRTKAEKNSETQSYLVEVVGGIQTVKAQNIELNAKWQWQSRYGRYISSSFESVQTSTTAGSLSNFLNKLSNLLLLWVGAYLVLQQQLTLGQLIAFRIIAGYTTSPLLRLIQLWQNFQETALSLERLADILDNPQETEIAGRSNIPMPAIQGAVRYDNITFSFAKSPNPQLLNISLDIPPGTFVGVVGQSGAGKSTLTKLLPRLYYPQQGRILVDGYDISKVELYSLRRQIGFVLQDTLLFDTTVQENIALTSPDATPEEVVEAAKIACAHDFIMNLPQGYETRVGERGSALSGGQRQRIAIARTVLQNPPLLILDEATSALDYDTERQVCLNLAVAFKNRTVFFITHRLATIRNADTILMMSQGSVIEQGSHAELIEMKGSYYCLYQQQEAVGSN